MKTIEERAIKASDIAKVEFEKDSYWCDYADEMVTSAFDEGFCEGYIRGATEQKAIDKEIEQMRYKEVIEAINDFFPPDLIINGEWKGIVRIIKKQLKEIMKDKLEEI